MIFKIRTIKKINDGIDGASNPAWYDDKSKCRITSVKAEVYNFGWDVPSFNFEVYIAKNHNANKMHTEFDFVYVGF